LSGQCLAVGCTRPVQLDALIKDMESPDFDEVSFGWQLLHIYAHLNAFVNRLLLAASHSAPRMPLRDLFSPVLFSPFHIKGRFYPKGSVADVSFQSLEPGVEWK